MKLYCADNLSGRQINELISNTTDDKITFTCVNGQRFIADGMKGKSVTVVGIAGNASGAYMDSGELNIQGNAQDAIGDTMNGGVIYISGNCGDATGYAMRGGEIYVGGDVGYRAGIHMKEYGNDKPVLVIGGSAGDFLGEYQAGGFIIVINRANKVSPLGDDYAAGMHGGKIAVFTDTAPIAPKGVEVREATNGDKAETKQYIDKFCALTTSLNSEDMINRKMYILTPMGRNPYQTLYVNN